MQSNSLNQTVLIGQNVGTPRFWRCRKVIYYGAIISMICVIVCTIALYSHYGPLTPNGNRYYHDFDLSTVPFSLVAWSVLSMVLLCYPSFRFYHSKNPEFHSMGIFPSSSAIISKIIFLILTILNIGSGVLFTLGMLLQTIEYCTKSSRVMADDLETGLLYFAFMGCTIVWGIIVLIYTLLYRKDW